MEHLPLPPLKAEIVENAMLFAGAGLRNTKNSRGYDPAEITLRGNPTIFQVVGAARALGPRYEFVGESNGSVRFEYAGETYP